MIKRYYNEDYVVHVEDDEICSWVKIENKQLGFLVLISREIRVLDFLE